MPTPVSDRAQIPPFEAMEAFREASELKAAGKDIIHLTLGQPARPAPKEVLDAVARAIRSEPIGYTDAPGLMLLRERIAKHYGEKYNVDLPARRIFLTAGSSAATFLALLAGFDAGQKIAIAQPCYPAYPNMMKATNLEPVYIATDETTSFQPRAQHLASLEPNRPHGLIIASPSNPAGTILEKEHLKSLAEYCEDFRIRLISDEIYHGISYGKETATAAAFSRHAFVVNSFSKYYLLPGWRLGWAVVPEAFLRSYESLSQSFFISPSAIAQYAALAVFDHLDYLNETVRHYSENRDLLLTGLHSLGFKGLEFSEGAFYVYANIEGLSMHSREFCHRLLHEAGVSAVPGTDFDSERGQHYVRFSYAGDQLELAEAVERMRRWLKS